MNILTGLTYFLTIKPRLKRIKKLLPEAEVYPCGSRYVCNPPVFFTDIDFLVYSELPLEASLLAAGYVKSGFMDYSGFTLNNSQDDFTTWRKGIINLIVTPSSAYKDGFIVATHLCKKFNVRQKYQRIVIYELLRGTTSYEELEFGQHESFMFSEVIRRARALCGPHRLTMLKAYQ